MYNFGKTDDLPQNLQMKQAYKMYQYGKKLQNTYKIPTFSYFKDRKILTFSYFGMKIPTFSYFFDLSYHFQPWYFSVDWHLKLCLLRFHKVFRAIPIHLSK